MSLTWFNGAMIDGPLAIDRGERGLLLGDGLFETMLAVNRVALWRNMHLLRLEAAAAELGIGFDRARVEEALAAVLAEAPPSHQVLRVTLSRGVAARGLAAEGENPGLLVTCDPFDPALMFRPVALATSTIRRNPFSMASRHKTLSYIDSIAAAREAAARGCEDALMLNADGKVASSSIANIFLLKGKTLVTPGRGEAILTGIMRQALIHAAAHLGFAVEERTVTPGELTEADAVFLTNSLRFIRPVTALDQTPLRQRDLSAFVEALCKAARLQCGHDPRLIWAGPEVKPAAEKEGR
ncbi:MAG: aminotransferase class IV [Aestuariivirga sp.]|uniref:aminotransferase class IV n=1 Tax=Aestuariivirga sp. TaxID=2650926 RepID=UPI0038CF4AEE